MSCLSYNTIINSGGLINENIDDSVSVFINSSGTLLPYPLTKICCETLKSGYTFDINTQICKWTTSTTNSCATEPIKVILNPSGNDGAIFFIDDNKDYNLDIGFDYLFSLKCETVLDKLNESSTLSGCSRPIDIFENLDISLALDIITSANTLQTVFSDSVLTPIGTGNLYNYLTTNTDSGFYVCGGPSIGETFSGCTPLLLSTTANNVFYCESIILNLVQSLFLESGLSGETFTNSLPENSFNSKWLNYSTIISDKTIINAITNKKIKISLNINNSCSDICILVDNIKLNQSSTAITTNNIFVTESPGFELERVIDNKKSWVDTDLTRQSSISTNNNKNIIRQTNYNINDEKLVLNSKEIDLDIDLASAIENDTWRYIVDNPCILSGTSDCDDCSTNCCGDNKLDFNELMSENLSDVITLEDFKYFLTSELIDAKSRQTLSGYPTLRALYDRYMNSELYCTNISSKFNYLTMEQFANLIGNYWVDIVEQVIPATTIWGSVKIYSNSIFDTQKYKYKSYTTLLGYNPFYGDNVSNPINGVYGICTPVTANIIQLTNNTGTTIFNKIINTKYDNICLAQMNFGSEFIGGVITNDSYSNTNGIYITENSLSVILTNTNVCDLVLGSMTATVSGGQAPYSYLWSNGETTQTAVSLVNGPTSVIVTDANHFTRTINFNNVNNICGQKQFQNGFDFDFMDGFGYGFMN
jgi:hypothetical protein